jgi:hypothetical protein
VRPTISSHNPSSSIYTPDFLSFFINNLYRGLYVGRMCDPGYQNWLPFQRRAEELRGRILPW